jgi:hypothetical protein
MRLMCQNDSEAVFYWVILGKEIKKDVFLPRYASMVFYFFLPAFFITLFLLLFAFITLPQRNLSTRPV